MGSTCEICKNEVIALKYDSKNKLWGCGDCIQTIFLKDLKFHQDVTSFFTDNKGREYAVNAKGKLVPEGDHRYNTKEDPHGWKATGKTPKKVTYFIK